MTLNLVDAFQAAAGIRSPGGHAGTNDAHRV